MVRKRLWFLVLILFSVTVSAQQSKPIQFREELFDFGNIAEGDGPAVHEFVYTNVTGRPVKILSVQASCGCTTPDWSKDPVSPGKTGFIQASFNPAGRPGYFNKTLTVTTDADASQIVLQIKGQVTTAAAKPAVTEFQAANGNWKLKTASFNMGKVYLKDEFVIREFTFVNGGSKPITYLDKFTSPKYIRIDVQPKTVGPGLQGKIKLSYNGKLRNQYGFQSDNVEIQTDDELNPVKSFSVYATLEDYFLPPTGEELAKAPQLRFADSTIDFGRVKQNTVSTKELPFTNTGKKDINIRSVQGNCTCISATAVKAVVKPGESSSIKISFDPQDRKGTQTKAVTVYSNDPQNPVQRVTFTAYVEY